KLALRVPLFYAGASRRGGARAQHADTFVKRHASSQFTLADRQSSFLKGSSNLAAVDQHRNPQPVVYVPQDDPAFESIAEQMTKLVLARDPRVGVEPKPRNPRFKA
ncbi:MAG TPA: hypothetical protein VEN30_24130, partial [Paraburkholderia sp.]|nr:hypothetical protein [Paraburkholderia sp.]